MLALYRLGIVFYSILVFLFSPFNPKARRFREGRKDWKKKLKTLFSDQQDPVVWFHAASLGEFEQGRPVIEALKAQHPQVKVLLTFFSPSGYEIRKNYPLADWVLYLPLDSPANARYWVDVVKPSVAVFIKYEFWYYYLRELTERKIPTLYVSCIFRSKQLFFHFSGRFFVPVLQRISHFFVQDENSKALASQLGITRVTVAGDTRFDRVLAVAEDAREIELAARFKANESVLILGSTWPSDMERVGLFIHTHLSDMKFIIAPHNLSEAEISGLEKSFDKCIRYSQAEDKNLNDYRVLIVDNMGMLSSLYRYGDFAYVGGAFRGALHNTLEAAVYGIPVFFGANPKNVKFQEAKGLVECGGGFTFATAEEFTHLMDAMISNEETRVKAGQSAGEFVRANTGATNLIINQLKTLLA